MCSTFTYLIDQNVEKYTKQIRIAKGKVVLLAEHSQEKRPHEQDQSQ